MIDSAVFDLRRIGMVLVVGLLVGCSGIKAYTSTPEKNLQIRTETKSGSMFSKVEASVDIYRVNGQCQTEYQGTVELNQPRVSVGIPAERLSYLVFNFSSSGFFSSHSSSVNHATLFKPRASSTYDIVVSYQDNIYHVVIREMGSRNQSGREIELKSLSACRER